MTIVRTTFNSTARSGTATVDGQTGHYDRQGVWQPFTTQEANND